MRLETDFARRFFRGEITQEESAQAFNKIGQLRMEEAQRELGSYINNLRTARKIVRKAASLVTGNANIPSSQSRISR
jgi:hypothetical protein